jgi:Predicted membrane protein
MPRYVLAFLIGTATGLRSLTAPAAVSFAAQRGRLRLKGGPLAVFGWRATPYVLTALALGELVNDKLAWTPSRRSPLPFAARVVLGAACGAAIGAPKWIAGGMAAGALGAVAGTLGGYELRTGLARAAGGRDLPIALSEDALAVGGSLSIVSLLA